MLNIFNPRDSRTKRQKQTQASRARAQLNLLVLENGKAYVDSNNQLCAVDPHSPELNEILRYMSSTPDLFGGDLFGKRPKVIKAKESDVESALNELQSSDIGGGREVDDTRAATRTAKLLKLAVDSGASDIHIRLTDKAYFLGRVDGRLKNLMMPQKLSYGQSLASYIFMRLARKNWSEQGDLDSRFTFTVNKDGEGEKEINWRISQMPADSGPKITIRNLDASALGDDLEFTDLGMTHGHAKYFWESLTATNGTIIVTGPTGSGKTTLICLGLLKLSNDEDKLIQTIEDPPEWLLEKINIVQTEVQMNVKVSQHSENVKDFAYFGRKVLRGDTDIVFVGELREKATAMVALRMGETGQVCLTTLHSNTAVSGVGTLIEQFDINPALLSAPGVLRGVAHQRLSRKVCQHCSYTYDQYKKIAETGDKVAIKAISRVDWYIENTRGVDDKDLVRNQVRFKNIKGCPHCHKGESGRTALFEFVVIDDMARRFISKRDMTGWENYLAETDWPSIRDHGVSKILAGICDVSTVETTLSDMVKTDIRDVHTEMKGSFINGH